LGIIWGKLENGRSRKSALSNFRYVYLRPSDMPVRLLLQVHDGFVRDMTERRRFGRAKVRIWPAQPSDFIRAVRW